MPLYPVLEKATYAIGDKVYGPGEHVDLTEGQAAPWLDLLLGPALTVKETKAALKAEAQAAKEEVKTNVG